MSGWSLLLNLTGNITFFLNIKAEECYLKILLFSYRNDLVFGSVETYFLKVHAYVCLKGASAGVSEGRFC